MRALIISFLILTSTFSFSQGKKCNQTVLSQTNARIDKLTSNEIRIFLSVFDSSCKNNVEFSEFSNELLFNVLEKHTKKVLLILEKQYPEIQLNAILTILEYPLVDTVDLRDLIQKAEKVKISEKIKKQVIDALQVSNNQ